MQYQVYATLSNGSMVFNGTMNYVPRVGEELEVNGHVFTVSNVRYVLKEGACYNTYVRLLLTQVI